MDLDLSGWSHCLTDLPLCDINTKYLSAFDNHIVKPVFVTLSIYPD